MMLQYRQHTPYTHTIPHHPTPMASYTHSICGFYVLDSSVESVYVKERTACVSSLFSVAESSVSSSTQSTTTSCVWVRKCIGVSSMRRCVLVWYKYV
ncbi:hypothetical protein EON65_40475 [archaeon]|nr:MAG: hypothetical protein EON65_40475 [archaeon]